MVANLSSTSLSVDAMCPTGSLFAECLVADVCDPMRVGGGVMAETFSSKRCL